MFGDDLLSLETPPRWSFANQHGTPSILSALCAHHVLTVIETKQLLEKPKQYQIHQVSMSTKPSQNECEYTPDLFSLLLFARFISYCHHHN